MSISKSTQYGNINISIDAIASLAGGVVSECYGVVGMASQKFLKDGIAELLKKENYAKGVVVRKKEDALELDVYIVVSYVPTNYNREVVYECQQIPGEDHPYLLRFQICFLDRQFCHCKLHLAFAFLPALPAAHWIRQHMVKIIAQRPFLFFLSHQRSAGGNVNRLFKGYTLFSCHLFHLFCFLFLIFTEYS